MVLYWFYIDLQYKLSFNSTSYLVFEVVFSFPVISPIGDEWEKGKYMVEVGGGLGAKDAVTVDFPFFL